MIYQAPPKTWYGKLWYYTVIYTFCIGAMIVNWFETRKD